MAKTVNDLKALREELVEQRRRCAYDLRDPHDDANIQKLAMIDLAIVALETVISEGKDETPRPFAVG
jgi:hypothetical protein